MSPDRTTLENEFLVWVVEWNDGEPIGDIDADTDLLGAGLLDSIGLIGLVTHMEERLSRAFDFDTFDMGEPASIRSLVANCRPIGPAGA